MSRPVVIVTGASRGIGLATVKSLLTEHNAIVAALSRTAPPELTELAETHKGSLSIYRCDIANESEQTTTISTILESHKRLDGIVLNAAVIEPLGRIADTQIPLDAWKFHFDVNFFSLVSAIRSSIVALRASKGKIIFISSGSAEGNITACAPYNAGKAAMNSLCRTLAAEEPDITCVALRPGMVDTGMQTTARNAGDVMEVSDYNKFAQAHEKGKLIKPEQSGHVIAALTLRAAKSLHGRFVSWEADECAEYRK